MDWWKVALRRLFPLVFACVGQLAINQSAHADDGALDLFSAETVKVTGDIRGAATDGEHSWVDGEFGKLRYGGTSAGKLKVRPEFGGAALVWQPRFTWSLSGTVVGQAQGGGLTEAGLSEAFVSFKPLSDAPVKISARAGLMWPPVSLEHSGPEWGVTETITPSAINSWIGEEVKVIGLEVTAKAKLGGHTLSGTAAIFDFNDTAGTMLAFRGWAMHDRVALAFRKQPLPELNEFIEYVQPRFSHPIIDMDGGVLRRPGYYAKLAWDLPVPVRIEALHYDNNANPEAVNADLEWGWRTKFNNVGVVADFAPGWQLRAQAMSGTTLMGFPEGGVIWVDTRFRAVYGMVTRSFDKGSISARVDVFDARNRGSTLVSDDDEDGWAATIAARRKLGDHFTLLAEALHVESTRGARSREGIDPKQKQNQFQLSLRFAW